MLRGLRGGYRFPLYSIPLKACSDIPRRQSFTRGDLTPVKWDFILLLETASQSLRLPSQHFVIRRLPAAFTAFTSSLVEMFGEEKRKGKKGRVCLKKRSAQRDPHAQVVG